MTQRRTLAHLLLEHAFFLIEIILQRTKGNKMDSLQPGDIIQFSLPGWNTSWLRHYAIYAGNDRLIQYTHDPRDKSLRVKTISFSLYMEISRQTGRHWIWKKYNSKDHVWPVIGSGEEIVKRAESRLGENRYTIIANNCEQFVYWARYGYNYSLQLNIFIICLTLIALLCFLSWRLGVSSALLLFFTICWQQWVFQVRDRKPLPCHYLSSSSTPSVS